MLRIQSIIIMISVFIISVGMFQYIEEIFLRPPTVYVYAITRRVVVNDDTSTIHVHFLIEQLPARTTDEIDSTEYRVLSSAPATLRSFAVTQFRIQRMIRYADGREIVTEFPDMIVGSGSVTYKTVVFIKRDDMTLSVYAELVRDQERSACRSVEWNFIVEGKEKAEFCLPNSA